MSGTRKARKEHRMLEWSCTFCSCFLKVLLSNQCLRCFQLKKIWMIICFKGLFPMLLQSYVLWYKKPCKFQRLSFSLSSVAVDFWLRSISCLLAFWQRAFLLFIWCHHCLLTMFVFVFWEIHMCRVHFLCLLKDQYTAVVDKHSRWRASWLSCLYYGAWGWSTEDFTHSTGYDIQKSETPVKNGVQAAYFLSHWNVFIEGFNIQSF